MIASKQHLLAKSLVQPSKIANALDWRKMTGSTVLSLDIHADRIGIALAGHPSSSSPSSSSTTTSSFQPHNNSSSSTSSIYHVESLPLYHQVHTDSKKNNNNNMKGQQVPLAEVRQRLSDIVRTHKVCGFVVSWPVQKDTGRLGAACGRTLHTLEQLLQMSSPSQPQQQDLVDGSSSSNRTTHIFSPSRPICLWDSTGAAKNQPRVDGFGRSVAFTLSSSSSSDSCSSFSSSSSSSSLPMVHSARQLQYHQDESITAEQVWEDFAKTFWPDQLEQKHQQHLKHQHAPPPSQQQQQQQQQHMYQRRSRYQEPECEDLSSIPSLVFAA